MALRRASDCLRQERDWFPAGGDDLKVVVFNIIVSILFPESLSCATGKAFRVERNIDWSRADQAGTEYTCQPHCILTYRTRSAGSCSGQRAVLPHEVWLPGVCSVVLLQLDLYLEAELVVLVLGILQIV